MSVIPPVESIEIPLNNDEVLEVPLNDISDGFEDEVLHVLTNEASPLNFYLQFALECYKRNHVSKALTFIQRGVSEAIARNIPGPATMLLQDALAHHHTRFEARAPGSAQAFAQAVNAAEAIESRNLVTQMVKSLNQVVLLGERKPWDEAVNRALSEMASVLNRFPECLPAMIGQACIFFYRADFKSALPLFQRALQIDPSLTTPDPRLGIGMCFLRLGHVDLARKAFDRSLELNPPSLAARSLLMQMDMNEYKRVSAAEGHAKGKPALDRAVRHLASLAAAERGDPTVSANALVALFSGVVASAKDDLDRARTHLRAAHDTSEVTALQAEAQFQRAKLEHRAGRWSEAENLYRAALAKDQRMVKARFAMARVLLQRGEPTLAAAELELVLEAKPEDIDVLKLAISTYTQCSDSTKALDKWEVLSRVLVKKYESRSASTFKGMDLDLLDDAELCLELAEVWQKQGDVKHAFAASERALIILEETPGARIPLPLFNNLAVLAHLDTSTPGNLDRAEAYYSRGLSHAASAGITDVATRDSITTIRYNIARLNEARGEVDRAKERYKQILDQHPLYFDASLRLGAIELSQNHAPEAEDHFKDVFSNDPSHVEAWLMLGELQRQTNQYKISRRTFEKIVVDNKVNDPYAMVQLGNEWLATVRNESNKEKKTQDLLRAVRQFSGALKVDSKNAYAAMGLGIALAEDGKYAEAKEIFESVRELAPDVPWVLMNLGLVCIELKQYEVAVSLFEMFGKRHPHLRDAYFYQALARAHFIHAEKEKKAEYMVLALRNIQKALRFSPTDKILLYDLAVVMQHHARIVVTSSKDTRTRPQLQQARSWTAFARSRFSWLEKAVDAAKKSYDAARKDPSNKSMAPPAILSQLPSKDKLEASKKDCDKLGEALDREIKSQERHEYEREKRFREAAAAKEAELKKQKEVDEVERSKAEAHRRTMMEEAAKKQEKLREDMRARDEKERQERERRKEAAARETKKRKKKDDGFIADEEEEAEREPKSEPEVEPTSSGRKEGKKKKTKVKSGKKSGLSDERIVEDDQDEDGGGTEAKAPSRRRLKRKADTEDEDDQDLKVAPLSGDDLKMDAEQKDLFGSDSEDDLGGQMDEYSTIGKMESGPLGSDSVRNSRETSFTGDLESDPQDADDATLDKMDED
ncbi:TPR-like protein [Gonapodya prolifera JEL478]|uniref:TPR-like protein n=1 Tax=Gonapodya prolifera (strain JEL478) TaxID=1344416 RepID=A0A139A719_GONPJ|nr:TPR-like protein [Gonapodya prolifera JEL478]|eukprot:KXS12448.1 TPR-like protein [Gonapodya prolifera JEL478]